ncbi:heavy metal-binding protein HIP-like [Mercenaria mercenaria]|uniref:heavy metal-binding protein HIP-like n=1 Tax=Mercenaria mercenaria TaxID=6596 RepID=UPI00234EA6EB|nr:heavy metal-binding protein HIP-like [Mercenaria mercenaria]
MRSINICLAVVFALNVANSEASDLTISATDYEHLLDRISQLEKKAEKQEMLKQRWINMETNLRRQRYYRKLVTLESRIAHIELQGSREQQAMKSQIIRLEEEMINQQLLIEKQQNTIETFRKMLETENVEDTDTDKEDTELEHESEAPKQNGGRIKRAIIQHPVAFTAVLDHNINHALIDQTVIFNKLLLNDGNGYSTHTGVFTAPREGMYMFYFVFASGYDPQYVWMQIVVDGSSKAAGVADTLQRAHDAQGSNLVILHLHPGDSVWVETIKYSDVTIYGSRGFTTFSGVLLYEY